MVNENYDIQYSHFMNQGFGWSNYFQIYLEQLGIEAYEIVLNSEPLQRAWAKKHNINYDGNLLINQLRLIDPDVIMVHDFNALVSSQIKMIKKEFPGLKQIIGYCCSSFSLKNMEFFNLYDYVLTCSPLFLGILKKKGIKCYLFPHAFESTLIDKINHPNDFQPTDFLFIGSLMQGNDLHNSRIIVLEELLKEGIDLTIYSNIKIESSLFLHLRQLDYFLAAGIKKAGLSKIAQNIPFINKAMLLNEMPRKGRYSQKLLDRLNRTQLFGLEMLQALSKAKIGFNIHGGIAGGYAANIRMFEVTGAGSLLLTDHKKNIKDFFEPDFEIITYSSVAECVEKTKWLLDNPEKIKEIAKAGQNRCKKDHSIQNRVGLLDEIIRKNL
jgi:hypothetical protein